MATDEERLEHIAVLNLATQVYLERDAVHKGLWKTMPPEECDELIKHKAKRVAHTGNEEDAIDLINYVVFRIRNERRRKSEAESIPAGPEGA